MDFFIEKTNNSIIQFIRYFFVGGLAAVVNIGGLYILSGIFGIQYLLANVIAFILGLITLYISFLFSFYHCIFYKIYHI